MESDATHLEYLLKIWAWFDKNKKQVQLGAVAVAGLVVVTALVIWQRSEKERKAGEALSDVFVPLVMAGPNARGSGAESYQKVALAHPGDDAGAQAMLLAATGLFTDGKFNEALAEFERFEQVHRDSALLGQVMLGRAASLDALGRTNDAVTAYNTLINQHPSESMIPHAKYSLARIYEAQGKLEQARNYYEEVGANRYSSIGSEAGIRLEELLQKHPELIPASPATVPMSKPITPGVSPAPSAAVPAANAAAVAAPKATNAPAPAAAVAPATKK